MKSKKTFCALAFILVALSGTRAQVNLQTGAATFSLPIFSYSGADNLATSAVLNYIDGNGLPVAEMAQGTGTGWQLLYGSAIRRQQKGLPDDQCRALVLQNPLNNDLQMSLTQYQDTYFPNGYLFSYYLPTDSIPNEGGYVRMGGTLLNATRAPVREFIAADREQDIFQLNLGQGNIEFVIGRDGTVRVLNDVKVKISLTLESMLDQHIKTRISKFTVTGVDGIQYVFADRELTRACDYTPRKLPDAQGYVTETETNEVGGTNNNTAPLKVYSAKRTNNYIVSAWYLSEISNPRTGKKIQFSYENYTIDMPGGRVVNQTQQGINKTTTVVLTREVVQALRIKSISCPPQAQADFIYETMERADVPGDRPLKEVQVKEAGQLVSKYVFEYGYFLGGGQKPYNHNFQGKEKFLARLCLKSVQKMGSDGLTVEKPHRFDYYEGTTGQPSWVGNLPAFDNLDIVPSMNTYWTDHWGYYNGGLGTSGLSPSAFFEYPPNCIPTVNELEQLCRNEPRRAPVVGLAKNGILKQVTYPMGGSLLFEYEQNQALYNGQNTTIGGVRVKQTTLHDGEDHAKDIVAQYKYVKEDGVSSSGWGYEPPLYSFNKASRIFRQSAGGSPLGLFHDYAINSGRMMVVKMGSMADATRVQAFKFISGNVCSMAAAFVVAVLADALSSDWKDELYTEYSARSYRAGNPLPFQYARVEVAKTIVGSPVNGKTVFEFSSDTQVPLLVNTQDFNFPFSTKSRYAKWAYGQPIRTAVYNQAGKLLTETINEYNTVANYLQNDTRFLSKSWAAQASTFDAFPSSHTAYLAEFGNVVQQQYYPLCGHSELKRSTERIYYKNVPGYTESVTDYTYNVSNYQPQTITTANSKGQAVQKRLYYPGDYTNIASMTALADANMHNIAVSTETWLNPNSTPRLTGLSVTDFATAPNGDIMPANTYSLEAQAPLDGAVIGSFAPSALVRNNNYIKEDARFQYNANGNLASTYDTRAKAYNSKMYNYGNSLVVAEVANAKHTEVAYTSFEGDDKGGWQFNSVNVANGLCPTGERYYQLASGDALLPAATINIPVAARLCCWATAPVLVSGSPATRTGPSVNGWVYYEFDLPPGSPLPSLAGNASIDELRLLPQNARMSTATYRPGIGKTSSCDDNNRIQYFGYDALGRLSKVFDEKRNLIKTFEYHTKN
jgi:hypothetical protein